MDRRPYAMVFAGLLLVGGSLADRFGRKRVFLIGLAVFAGGSIGAAFSGSVDLLITWRAVMGAGAALTIPSSLSILNDVFRDPKERARAIGVWGGTIGLGIAIGPIAGGLLLAELLVGLGVSCQCPDRCRRVRRRTGPGTRFEESLGRSRPDPAGAVLSVAGLGLLLWAIIEAPAQGWASERCSGSGSQALSSSAVRRLGSSQSPPHVEPGLLLRTSLLHRCGSRVPRYLWAAGGAVLADAVLAVRPWLVAA